MIPHVEQVQVRVHPLNARLFELCGKEAGGKLTPVEKHELEALCRTLESEQDNQS